MLNWLATHLGLRAKLYKTPQGQRALLLTRHGINLFLDVGANVGQTGLALRKSNYSGRIVSFEPQAQAHQKLCQAAAGDAKWEVAEPLALGAASGELDIHVSEADDLSSFKMANAAMASALPRVQSTRAETVKVARLDEIFDRFAGPDDRAFLKIDAQGFEAEVLQGSRGILDRIHGLQMELSLFPLYEGEVDMTDMMVHVRHLGFEPWLILPVTFSRTLCRQLQVDAFFFRREARD